MNRGGANGGSTEDLVKIAVDINGHWSGMAAETMWAASTNDGLFELRNTPFYAYGLSWGDVVSAELRDDGFGERLCYDAVIRRGGHRTLRIFFTSADELIRPPVLGQLNELKASHEHAQGRFYAIDVMPDADYDLVTDALNRWVDEGLLDWELGSDSL